MRDIACTLCGTVEDHDDFIAIGKRNILCKSCRTCTHGKAHYEEGRDDVCYHCVRQFFTVLWWWGPTIPSLEAYTDFALQNGIPPEGLLTWTLEEEQLILDYYGVTSEALLRGPAPWLRLGK